MAFFFPYLQVVTLASRQLLQLYETLSRGSVDVFTSGSLTSQLGIAMMLLLVIVILGFCFSSYSIYNRTGATGVGVFIALISVPGIAALFNIEWFVQTLSKQHHFVAGGSPYSDALGDVHGLISLLSILMFFGWSFFLFLQIKFDEKKVKSIIDHLWYPSGLLLAAVFLLSQTDEQKKWSTHNDYENLYSQRAETILRQNRLAYKFLLEAQVMSQKEANLLEDYFIRSVAHFRIDGPVAGFSVKDKADKIFGENWKITKQLIDRININVCKDRNLILECYHWNLKDFSLTNGSLESFGPAVLIPYQYFDVLSELSIKIENSFEKFRNEAPSRAIRLLIFCLLAVFAGAKISTASYTLIPQKTNDDSGWRGELKRTLVSIYQKMLRAKGRLRQRLRV